MEIVAALIAAAGLAAAAAFWMQARHLRADARESRRAHEQVQAELLRKSGELASATTALAQERQRSDEQGALLETRFRQLSHDILEDKSKRFTDQNRENLENILRPLRERIAGFEQQVRDSYDKETRDRVALVEQIRTLQSLNQKVSLDANNLALALRGQSKVQGAWGEMILERLLELSGLTRGREYEIQVASQGEDGQRRRPDAIIHLPDQRDIVIDAKVSLTAYVRATAAATEEESRQALAEHVASVRTHLQSLSLKEYQNLENVRTLDFVLMFVPSESAYIEALRAEPKLFEEALARNIGIVSPSTLLPTLRTVENVWRYERQGQNAREIAERAGRLYDKFAGLVDDFDKIGRSLEGLSKTYTAARGKLSEGRGNLVDRVEELRELGVKTTKQLPRPAPFELQSPEVPPEE